MEQPLTSDDPMQAKLELARFIVRRAWEEDAVRAAEGHFTRVVREHVPPEDIPDARLPDGDPIHLPKLLVDEFGTPSTSQSRNLIAQGGVKIDGEAVYELDLPRDRLEGKVLQVGKRHFRRLTRG